MLVVSGQRNRAEFEKKMQMKYMAREKRGLDSSSGDEGRDRKRPALARSLHSLLFFPQLSNQTFG